MEILEIVNELKNPESKMAARVILKLLCHKEVSERLLKDLNAIQVDGELKIVLEQMKNLAQAIADNFELEEGHAPIF